MLLSPSWKHLLQGSPRISPGTWMGHISIENFIIEGMPGNAILRPKQVIWKPPCTGLNIKTILCWHSSLSTTGIKQLHIHSFRGVRIAEVDQSHYSKWLWRSPVFSLFFPVCSDQHEQPSSLFCMHMVSCLEMMWDCHDWEGLWWTCEEAAVKYMKGG